MPKTGTSALQVFLPKNYDVLLRYSVDYLRVGEFTLGKNNIISAGNGANLARSLLKRNIPPQTLEPQRYISEFFDAVVNSSADTGLISSEMFSALDWGLFQDLLTRLGELSIRARVIYFIREQTQHLCSLYIQQVKRHQCTMPAEEFADRFYRKIDYLRYFSFHQRLIRLFGEENVVCRVYDSNTLGAELFRSFLRAINVDAAGFDMSVGNVNASVTAKELQMMLLLNRFNPRQRFSDIVVENSVRAGNATLGHFHELLPEELSAKMAHFFAGENAALAKHYFGRDKLFLASPVAQLECPTVSSLGNEDLVSFLGGLLVQCDRRIARLEEQLSGGHKYPGPA